MGNWPQVRGTVTGQDVREDPPGKVRSARFAAIWRYPYTVDGKTFNAQSDGAPLAYSLAGKYNAKDAREDLNRRPLGSQVTVLSLMSLIGILVLAKKLN